MRNQKLITLMKISLLSVMAFLLQYIDMPIPLFPEFLKMDISDLPALIGAFSLGPIPGVIIELFKNILHGFLAGKTAFIGELANFLLGGGLVFVAGGIYNLKKSKTGAVISLISGVIAMSALAGILNYFLILPLYEKVLGFPMAAIIGMGSKVNSNITNLNSFIIWAIVPFTLLKGLIVSVLTLAVYKSVSPILHKDDIDKKQIISSER